VTKESVILAGGFGFLGRNLIERMEGRYNLVVLDRRIDTGFLRSHASVDARECDLSDEKSLTSALGTVQPDYIVNLVSVVDASRDLALFPSLIDSNLSVLLCMFAATRSLHGLKLFIQFGSAEEYGPIDPPFREEARENPASPYALIKLLTTNTALMLHRNYGYPAVVVRPGNAFGKYQPADRLIPYLIQGLKSGRTLEMTEGKQERDFIYAPDLAEGILGLLRNHVAARGQIVNISYGKGVTIRSLAEHLVGRLGSHSMIRWGVLPYRPNEIMRFQCDTSVFQGLTGIRFSRDCLSALDNFLNEGHGAEK
jgi:UDP-glucose 4-epimerase